MALVGPKMPNIIHPVYTCGYSDQPEALNNDGMVSVPDQPGLGVSYDWEFINQNKVSAKIFGTNNLS